MLGINPGRLGAGLTGVPFTDPVNLEKNCGIPNAFAKKPELSSDFIYRMIDDMGGPESFYRKFFITSVCPLGFIRKSVNMNYYDDKELLRMTEPFIIRNLKRQLEFGCRRETAFVIGEGKNLYFLERINGKYGFFDRLVPLPHPRFVMQYRRKDLKTYLKLYKERLREVSGN